MMNAAPSAGALIREWRVRRRMSQLDLAGEADISQRHLSFLESGRAAPSREMVVRLAERLDIPLRQRNRLLLAAGFAPGYRREPTRRSVASRRPWTPCAWCSRATSRTRPSRSTATGTWWPPTAAHRSAARRHRRCLAARAAGQRAAAQPASAGARAAHRQSRGMAGPSPASG